MQFKLTWNRENTVQQTPFDAVKEKLVRTHGNATNQQCAGLAPLSDGEKLRKKPALPAQHARPFARSLVRLLTLFSEVTCWADITTHAHECTLTGVVHTDCASSAIWNPSPLPHRPSWHPLGTSFQHTNPLTTQLSRPHVLRSLPTLRERFAHPSVARAFSKGARYERDARSYGCMCVHSWGIKGFSTFGAHCKKLLIVSWKPNNVY